MKLFKVSRDMIVTLYKQFGKDVYKVPIVGLVTGGKLKQPIELGHNCANGCSITLQDLLHGLRRRICLCLKWE